MNREEISRRFYPRPHDEILGLPNMDAVITDETAESISIAWYRAEECLPTIARLSPLIQTDDTCRSCKYYSGDYHLKCAVNPTCEDGSECGDFESKEPKSITEQSDNTTNQLEDIIFESSGLVGNVTTVQSINTVSHEPRVISMEEIAEKLAEEKPVKKKLFSVMREIKRLGKA